MAEAELTLKYREPSVTMAHFVLLLAVPVLVLFVLLCSLSVWMQTGAHFANISLFLFSLFLTLLAVIGGILLTSDQTIFLSRDGISLPFVLSPALKLRVHHGWSELAALRLLPQGKNGVLLMSFKKGAKLRLNLDLLTEKDIENLIVSMDVWCGGADAFPALFEARMRFEEKQGALELPGYTELWEDELSRRFGPTNFIPLEPGETAGQYKVERQLAFGGLSALYVVRDAGLHSFVLKEAVVPADADEAMRAAAEKMLNREAEILSSLEHPHIAKVLDNFVDKQRQYLLMELIEGEDLRCLVKEQGAQPEKDVAFWALQLLSALEYLHGQKPPVLHRDLSPDNLMLKESGEICIIDFGAANHFVGTATGTMIGKQCYIAPEQLRGKAEPASDIYAFGGTLHFLLCGADPEALAVAHPRLLKESISEDFDLLVASCTAQEAGQRPLAAEIKTKLLKLSGGQKGV